MYHKPQVQMAKMRSELSRLKDQMKDSEAALAGKDAEVRWTGFFKAAKPQPQRICRPNN
jgi:hypothetical protein